MSSCLRSVKASFKAFCASSVSSRFSVSVISCSRNLIFMLFVHLFSSVSESHGSSAALKVRLWEFIFHVFLCIQWIFFVSRFLVSSFSLFSILRLFVHPFDSFSFSGLCRRTSFLVKTIAETLWCGFCFSAIVLSSSSLAKKRSELNGCRKTLTFEKPFCSHASPDSPLDARK